MHGPSDMHVATHSLMPSAQDPRAAPAAPGGRAATAAPVPAPAIAHARAIFAISAFSALSAIAGAIELLAYPTGGAFVPLSLLRGTPFATFAVPGLLLGLVVGGASLASAILARRRSRAALDAALVAGAAMTVWIGAEVALLRALHWLHVVYGAAGLALLALAISAARRSGSPRLRWTIAVTAAETLGFLAPALAGIALSRPGAEAGDGARLLGLAAAGLVEGAALGTGQALALPFAVRRGRFIALTAAAAALVWASVMGLMALGGSGAPAPLVATAGVVGGAVALAAFGTAQWLELRRHVARAGRWIGWTALAWLVALPLSFLPGPLVDETTPLAAHVALWGAGGMLMAFAVATITWRGVRAIAPGAAQ